jgi:Flp pilus assembly protein TadD
VGKQITEEADSAVFAQAFRQVFTVQRARRNPVAAVQALQKIAAKYPSAAAIPRVLGYAAVDHGFQHQLAIKHYLKAVQLDPNYGEVHYALAFMYVIGTQKAKGGIHYIKALELGIKDNRNIGKRFYPNLVP